MIKTSKETIKKNQYKLFYKGYSLGYYADTREKCEKVRDKYIKHKGWNLEDFEITGGHTMKFFSMSF